MTETDRPEEASIVALLPSTASWTISIAAGEGGERSTSFRVVQPQRRRQSAARIVDLMGGDGSSVRDWSVLREWKDRCTTRRGVSRETAAQRERIRAMKRAKELCGAREGSDIRHETYGATRRRSAIGFCRRSVSRETLRISPSSCRFDRPRPGLRSAVGSEEGACGLARRPNPWAKSPDVAARRRARPARGPDRG